jgi:hypothetical protein
MLIVKSSFGGWISYLEARRVVEVLVEGLRQRGRAVVRQEELVDIREEDPVKHQ